MAGPADRLVPAVTRQYHYYNGRWEEVLEHKPLRPMFLLHEFCRHRVLGIFQAPVHTMIQGIASDVVLRDKNKLG